MGFTQISLGAHSNPISFLWNSHRFPWAHTATRSLFFRIHTDIPGRTQQPDLFSLEFTQISLGAHSNPISFFFVCFFWDSHRYPWAHTATRSLFFGIHTDFPGRTQQPDLFSLGFTQISLGAHSNPISFFLVCFFWDSHRYPWTHTATRSLFFGIHTDIPGRTQQPDLFFSCLFFLGFTQISLDAHSNPISFLWDSHRYPWAHTAARSLFFGIHTDFPGRTQQPDLFFFCLFFLGFTQISLGAHSNPISLFFFLSFFGIHTDIPGRTQQSDLFFFCLFFFWDSHRYPWAHTATQSLFFFSFFFWDSHRYPWAHTATQSLFFFLSFFGIHTDIPGRTQQPDLFSLGFTQISLGAHSNPISFLWDSHRYPWAHTATRSLFFGTHTDIPGRTQQPDLFSLGFTQISLGAHSNPISFLWDSHRYPWAHTATPTLFFGIHTDFPGRTQQPELFSLGFTQISQGAHSNPSSSRWDSHRYPWAHTEALP